MLSIWNTSSHLSSPFLLPILYYSHGSSSNLQMSGIFSSEQHKFSRMTREAKRKKRKHQTLNQDYLLLFTSSKQAASPAGLAPLKPRLQTRVIQTLLTASHRVVAAVLETRRRATGHRERGYLSLAKLLIAGKNKSSFRGASPETKD